MPIQYGLLTKEQLNAIAALLPDVGLTATTGSIYAIGAVKNNYICGVLIFRADGELLIDIQYIAVAEPYRRQGIATGLLDFLCESAWESTTAIFCTFAAADWDEPLCRLFIRRGDFTLTEAEGYICRFPCKELSRIELNTAPPAGTHIATFYDLPKRVQNRFLNEMKKDNLEFSEGIRAEYEQMLRPLCICVVDSSENIQAAFFCQGREHDVELPAMYMHWQHCSVICVGFFSAQETIFLIFGLRQSHRRAENWLKNCSRNERSWRTSTQRAGT